MSGVIIGLRDVHTAILTSDEKGTAPVYEAPVPLVGAIAARVNPNASNSTLFADDGPFDSAATIGEIGLELNVATLTLEQQARLLGHKITGGILRRNAGDTPPWLAVGYRSLKSNGKFQYVWNLKGKFNLPEQNNQTKGDSIEWNTPTINGAFVKRVCDDEWQIVIDEDSETFTPELATNWFKLETLTTLASALPVTP